MNEPLVSIVVPTLNQAAFIEQTLASIVGQNWPRLELIVIDGGSNDGTHAVVERYRHAIAHFISEPDRGQADAINKGFRLATGDVLAWLNSDDMYLPCTLQTAVRALGDTSAPCLAYGACITFYEGSSQARTLLAEPFDRERLRHCDYIFQPSAFWTRALWERTGELNEALHFTLDWDWWLRAAAHCDFTPIPQPLSLYRFHTAHKSGSGSDRRTREVVEFVEKHAGPEWGAAFREVSANMTALADSHDRLRRINLHGFRTWLHRGLYRRHGAKVKVAMSQLRST